MTHKQENKYNSEGLHKGQRVRVPHWDPQHLGPATGSLHLPTRGQQPLLTRGHGNQSEASHIYHSTHSRQPSTRVGTVQPTEESHSTGDQSGETRESPATEGHFSKVWKCTSLSEIQGFPGGAGVKDSLPSAGNAGDVRDPG